MGRPQALRPAREERRAAEYRERFARAVPDTGGVVAALELLPRFASRPNVHALHHFLKGVYTYSDKPYPVPRGIAALIGDVGRKNLLLFVNAGTSTRWRELMRANDLRPADVVDDLLLFTRRPARSPALIAPATAVPLRPRLVEYERQLAFLGSTVEDTVAAAGEPLRFRTFWARLAPADRFYVTEIMLVDEQGQPAVERLRYLGYTLYPVAEWPERLPMRETYRLLLPRDLAPGRYGLGLRVWGKQAQADPAATDDPTTRASNLFVDLGWIRVTPPRGE